jgi:autotransporter passenger strand-loop-strand repeat protein
VFNGDADNKAEERAMTTYTAPPNQVRLTLNNGDTLDVEDSAPGPLATSIGTTINRGGVENVGFLGTSIGTTINNGGVENVLSPGAGGDGAGGTTINSGGVLNVSGIGSGAGDTTINNGGVLNVAFPAVASNVTFGNQNGVIITHTVLGSLNHAFSTLSLQAPPVAHWT